LSPLLAESLDKPNKFRWSHPRLQTLHERHKTGLVSVSRTFKIGEGLGLGLSLLFVEMFWFTEARLHS